VLAKCDIYILQIIAATSVTIKISTVHDCHEMDCFARTFIGVCSAVGLAMTPREGNRPPHSVIARAGNLTSPYAFMPEAIQSNMLLIVRFKRLQCTSKM